jgi:hypothetical protein
VVIRARLSVCVQLKERSVYKYKDGIIRVFNYPCILPPPLARIIESTPYPRVQNILKKNTKMCFESCKDLVFRKETNQKPKRGKE